jgi:Asp-tRNA(Asn)/Glu-tRNA(Gln) amidotransferase A subunit family amidase
MLDEDILYLSAHELGEMIKSRKLSPVELAESYLERSERIGKRLNAYAVVTRDLALNEAREAESEINQGRYRGPLHGIPYAAKDLLAVKGYKTSWGAKPFANQTFDYDATVIKKLREAGAVLIGKAAMIELAGGMGYRYASASISGPAKNPWNEKCWTCGSSSGSGAVTGAALAAFAIGTETWGSIVCPSAYCGLSGLRPTYGRVSRHGGMALSFSMDKIGVIARCAEDCALVFAQIAGHDPEDSTSLPDAEAKFDYNPTQNQEPLRIGLITNAWKEISPDVEPSVKAAFDKLREAGARIDKIELPEGPWEAAAATIINVEGASAFEPLIKSGLVGELTDPLGKVSGYVNRQISAIDYQRSQRIRSVLQRKIDEIFDRFDVIVAASLPVTATTLETNLETDLAFPDPLGAIGNLCGLPAVSVPCGLSSKNLPAGIQFIARPLDDDKAIAAARLFQQKTDWHKKRPILQ